MTYQGESPWHNLGNRMTAEQAGNIRAALTAANLDWTVGLQPLFTKVGDSYLNIENRRAVVRDGDSEILGVVSKWYEPIQNSEAFGIFEPAMDEFGLTVEAAGALGHGERVWMLFKFADTILSPVPGDDVRGYGVAITGHDGKTIDEFRPTPIRVVCQNTLNAAVGVGGKKGRLFGISHGGNVKNQIDAARVLTLQLLKSMQETGDTFASMARKQMTPEEVVTYIERVFPNPKADEGKEASKQLQTKRQQVAELVFRGKGAELAMSATNGLPNPWAAYNAVTEYFDHVSTGEAKTDKQRVQRATSALFGDNELVKLQALQLARQLVAA
jgi:phage/plasmid-like protein (TIGR03299 family)